MESLPLCACGCGLSVEVDRRGKPNRYRKACAWKARPASPGCHPPIPPSERFWDKVDKTEGCWLWTGATMLRYGTLKMPDHTRIKAHRLSWEMHYGPIPPGMMVCHRCDTPACVRPDHLFLGTDLDNIRDMYAKKRDGYHAHLEKMPHKLTEEQVRAIRSRAAGGVTAKALAKEYGVQVGAVFSVLARRSWKEVI